MKRLIEKLYLEGKLKDEYNTPGYVAPPRTYPPSAPRGGAVSWVTRAAARRRATSPRWQSRRGASSSGYTIGTTPSR